MRPSEIFNSLLNSVSEITETSRDEIVSTDTRAEVCQARNLFFLMCKRSGLRPVAILRICKDNGWNSLVHSTVIKNISKAEKLEKDNKLFKRLVDVTEQNI
tara:strand:+ start:1877 stop:2179 length:303 start_codon:yes stop_codon:yes gene_type:complete